MSASLMSLAREALLLALSLSLPVVGLSALVGSIVAVLQAATQVQDPVIRQLPRLLVVVAALVLGGSTMGTQLVQFTERVFSRG